MWKLFHDSESPVSCLCNTITVLLPQRAVGKIELQLHKVLAYNRLLKYVSSLLPTSCDFEQLCNLSKIQKTSNVGYLLGYLNTF